MFNGFTAYSSNFKGNYLFPLLFIFLHRLSPQIKGIFYSTNFQARLEVFKAALFRKFPKAKQCISFFFLLFGFLCFLFLFCFLLLYFSFLLFSCFLFFLLITFSRWISRFWGFITSHFNNENGSRMALASYHYRNIGFTTRKHCFDYRWTIIFISLFFLISKYFLVSYFSVFFFLLCV